MASKQKQEKIFSISVVGMSGTETERGVTGVGKSCLCSRFMRPHADDYYTDHISVISAMDFSGRIVNNDHFLYWGETTKKFDGDQMTYRVVEQTEFIDDSSFSPLRGSNTHAYFKRASVTKLQSAEKVMYICKDQVGDETNFEQRVLPDGKFVVDGFLIVYDVSKSAGHEKQQDWLTKLHGQLSKTKRPVVVVATKWDEGLDSYIREARTFANKIRAPLIETSAQEGVNVDLAFATLACKIDKRGGPREVPFVSANESRARVISQAVEAYTEMLKQDVTNYHELWTSKKRQYQNNGVFQKVVELVGTKMARTHFNGHTRRLRQEHQQKKQKLYLDRLPEALENIFPDLNSIGGRDWSESRQVLPEMDDFDRWFLILPEGQTWRDSEYIDTDGVLIPYDLLEGNETECENCFVDHVNRLNAAKRKEKMKEEFRKLLESLPTIVLPSRSFGDSSVQGAIEETESFKELDPDTRMAIYNCHQRDIQERAQADFTELLMENYALLAGVDIRQKPKDEVDKVERQLKEEERYRRLSEMHMERYIMLIKMLAFVQGPSTETCSYGEKCMERLIQYCIERNAQRSPMKDSLGSWDESNNKLSITIMGEEGLAVELEAEIKSQSYDGDYTLDKVLYTLDLKTIEGDITHPSNQLVTDRFTPKGCICVFTSLEGFQYVRDCLERTILSEEEYNSSPLRDLAVVLMFGRSTSPEADTAQVREQAERLCSRLNNCQIVNVPADNTTLWQRKKFSESQIQDALRSVVAGQKYNGGALNQTESDLGEKGDTAFRIGFCMPCGDPFQPELVLSPVTSHACTATPDEDNCLTCDMFLVDTKCRVDFEVASYHQADRLRLERVHHGYILVYAAQRKASLQILRWFLKIIQPIPTLVVAVCEDINSATEGIAEGNRLVDETKTAKLVTANCSTFREQTVIYNKFLKEAFDRRKETERMYKLDICEETPLSPGDRPPMELPSPSALEDPTDEGEPTTPVGEEFYDDIGSAPGRRNSARSSNEARTYHTPNYEMRPRRWGSEVRRKPNSALPPTPQNSSMEDLYDTIDKPTVTSTPKPKPEDTFDEDGIYAAVNKQWKSSDPASGRRNMSESEPIYAVTNKSSSSSTPRKARPRSLVTEGLYAEVNRDRTSTPDARSPSQEDSGMIDNALYDSYQPPASSRPSQSSLPGYDPRSERSQSQDSEEGMQDNPIYAPWQNPPPPSTRPRQPPAIAPKPGIQKVKVARPSPPSTPRPANLSTTSEGTPNSLHPDVQTPQARPADRMPCLKRPHGNQEKAVFISGLNKLLEQSKNTSFQDSDSVPSEVTKTANKKKKPKKVSKQKPGLPKKPSKPPLEEMRRNENSIPFFIAQCVEWIESNGLMQEGIYRVSGKVHDIDIIIKMVDENQEAKLDEVDNLGTNAVASALKQFFKNLPEPIIPYNTQERMIADYKELNNENLFVQRLPEYLTGLSDVTRTVLAYMMRHMKRITEYSDENLMTAENLAICWWPSMLHPQSQSFDDLANEALLGAVFKLIVAHSQSLFNFT